MNLRGLAGVIALVCLFGFFAKGNQPEIHIIGNPLSITVGIPGQNFPGLAIDGHSAFYIASNDQRIYLEGEPICEDHDGFTRLTYNTSDGRVAIIAVSKGDHGSIIFEFSLEDRGEYEKLGVQFVVTKKEGFYGLMERVVQGSEGLSWSPDVEATLNLRGQIVDLYTIPTVSLYAPFFLSSAGYGVWVKGSWPATFRFGVNKEGKVVPRMASIESEDPAFTFVLIPGPQPVSVVEKYARLSGLTWLPARFMLWPGRWRDEVWDLPFFYDGTPYSGPYNSMLVEDVLMMNALDIPCGWIVIDRPWASGSLGYGEMVFDGNRWPNHEEMIKWLSGRDIRTLLWIGPWIMDCKRNMAVAEGYQVKLTLPYLPGCDLVDFTNPAAVDWWIDQLAPLISSGIAGFKLDRGEEKTPDGQVFTGSYYDGTSYREGHNAYPLWFSIAARAAANKMRQEDFVLFYRSGWRGSSGFTVSWGGDTDPSALGLRSAIIALQRSAIINVPVWGSDTGGYNTLPSREVFARWLEFSCFCPIMEVGPTANLAPWSWLPDGSNEKLTQSGYVFDTLYDAEMLAIWSLYANLHVDLVDYTYFLAEQSATSGTPIVRPMFMAYPDNPGYIDMWDQYLYGPDILVRPVWEPGTNQVTVHIPQGEWIYAWTGVSYCGPKAIQVQVPLHVIPIFLRKGSVISFGDLLSRWQSALDATSRQPDLSQLSDSIPAQ